MELVQNGSKVVSLDLSQVCGQRIGKEVRVKRQVKGFECSSVHN